MMFMVVERFKGGSQEAAGRRFRDRGRMLPEGLDYVDSWMEGSGQRCFQLMKTEDPLLLDEWAAQWTDLVEFEFVAVETSAEFWSANS